MSGLPAIAVRLLDGRVGSTLLMQLLATSDEVVFERSYPEGERRYLSYCMRVAQWVGTHWDPAVHPGVTELFFGPADRVGPIPFEPTLVDVDQLGPAVLKAMWNAVSDQLRRSSPAGRYYAEKLVGDARLLFDSGIPLHLIDLVRDPRDVFCSIRAFTAGGGFGRRAGQSDEEFAEQMVARQHQQLQVMAVTPSNVRRTVIRYEDLIANLSAQAEKLSSWLDLRLDVPQVIAATHRYREHMTSASAADSVGRWRRELEPQLAIKLWHELGPLLEPLGYSAT